MLRAAVAYSFLVRSLVLLLACRRGGRTSCSSSVLQPLPSAGLRRQAARVIREWVAQTETRTPPNASSWETSLRVAGEKERPRRAQRTSVPQPFSGRRCMTCRRHPRCTCWQNLRPVPCRNQAELVWDFPERHSSTPWPVLLLQLYGRPSAP